MIKAVIFDRDGILVDSETCNVGAGVLAMADLGVKLTKNEKDSIICKHPREYASSMIQKYNLNYDEFRNLQYRHYTELLKEAPAIRPAIELLKKVREKGFLTGLCTGSGRQDTEDVLRRLGIEDLFEQVVTNNDYTNRKPNPEPYLLTAQKLGVKPSECLVIEDSEAGLRSAVGAGMRCIVIYNNLTKNHDFTGASAVFSSADQIDLDEVL